MNLKVQKIDPYQFVNKCFTIAVVLPDSFPDISRRISNLPLKVDVCFDDESYQSESLDRSYHPNLVEVVSNTNIDRSRRGLVTLRLKEPSSANSNKKYVIKFTALSLEGETTSIVGYSVPIMAVRHKLKISEEFAGHGSYVWMKDVGGKDKSIDLQVGLVDANDSYVLNRRVPLRVALLYASGTPVPQQDILQLSPDSQLLIAQNGFTRIKCRINEVSSRHQGQLFQILISPESDLQSLSLGDISPAHSVPVEVKSKINFSHKRKLQALGESAAGEVSRNNATHLNGIAGAVTGKDGSDPGRHVPKYDTYLGRSFDAYSSSNHSLSSSTLPGALSNVVHGQGVKPSGGLGGMGPLLVQPLAPPATSASILPLSSVLSNSGRSDNHTNSTSSSNHVSALSVSSSGSNPNLKNDPLIDAEGRLLVHAPPFPQNRSNDALNEMYHRAMQFSSEAATPIHGLSRTHSAPLLGPVPPIETSLWGRSSVQAAEALKDLTSWVEMVYSSLREMQWTPLGQLPGAINPETGLPIAQEERLLYNMKNPNKLIESLALGYQERVLAHLTTLDSFITLRALTPKGHSLQPSQGSQSLHSEKNNHLHHNHHIHRPVGSYHTSPNPIAAADIEQLLQLRGAESHFSTNNTNINTNHLTNSSLPAGGSWEHFQPQPSSPRASSRGAPGVTASGNTSVVYEQSPVRIVYTEKVVYALIGPEKQELLLGFATFGSVEGALRFIGFYAMQEDGALGFKSHSELLSLRPGNRTTTTTTTSSNATTTTTSSSATTTNTSPVVSTTTTTTTAEGSADPVQQLLRQISAAELHNAVTVRRDSTTAAFDLNPVAQAWNKKDSAARILIYVE
uniref:Uncharacterized protein n=1 Tax=Spumella elongata TaxID=89044 RepID=A0A7S3MI57_9STRA|mmetsp:Transcript_62781/g.110946  ORF Transcript_62781/g.110946 Transcript_62781/m.110946 type:complete len:849 (+) Transcript_62781:145-2691(+)